MRARAIAFYLPQYHPVEENDKYWGKGFTEWTNVARAEPLFRGHEQPNLPADLGFYDLRLPQVRKQQAELAKEAGIEGFCYWHYRFGKGKRVLDMPFREVLQSGEPDFPFCLGWANHHWTTKTWEKGKSTQKDAMIFEQTYNGDDDYTEYFYEVLPAFQDKRYIRVEGKPLFVIYSPDDIPDAAHFIELWNCLAVENGLDGVYFIGYYDALPDMKLSDVKRMDSLIAPRYEKVLAQGFDGILTATLKYAEFKSRSVLYKAIRSLARKYFGGMLDKYHYDDIVKNFYTKENYQPGIYPQLIPKRDRSPRSGKKAIIYYGSTPKGFEKAVENAIACVENRDPEHRLIFINAWNEWGEGAYLEPDLRYGHGYIDALRRVLDKE